MFLVKKVVSAWILSPAGLGILILLGVFARRLERRRLAALVTGTAGVLLIVLSLPKVSNALLRFVEVAPSALTEFKDVQAVVILGGGIHRGAPEYATADTLSSATLVRIRYGAWLAKRTHVPVLVSGGSVFGGAAEAQLMADALQGEFGVPVRWIEATSKDTAENAMLSAKLLKQAGVSRIALVSHAYHLRRARALFAQEGMTVVSAPTFSSLPIEGLDAWLPSANSLSDSFVALHELVGSFQGIRR